MILPRQFAACFFTALALLAATSPSFAQSPDSANSRIELHDGWMLQSSCKVSEKGARISLAGFRTDGWHATTVPSTVVAALIADKTYPDPYFGDNLRSIPGTTYAVGKMFSVMPMPKDSPFRCSWWYRTEFQAPKAYDGQHVWLNFGGINNRANIWLNGRRIAESKDITGAYRAYEFDITPLLVRGGHNVLAVETIAQTEKDLGINWVDWNPTPPDKNMGLWREVFLRSTGAVEIRDPQVITHFPDKSLAEADLTVETEIHNAGATQVIGTLEASLEGRQVHQPVTLAAGESRTIRFAPDTFAELRVQNPELWWPHQMGAPALHLLALRFLLGEQQSDSASIRYGIREVTSEIDPQGHRLFRVNAKRILIRGGGWAPDMLLRESPERLKTQFDYLRDLNLNAVRLEGPTESDAFFDLADEQGILVIAGWTCCDYWQKWTDWKQSDIEIATASLRSQIARLRSHPSMLAWLNGSDRPPPAEVERPFLSVLKELDWPNPVLSSASENITPLTGSTGVKMRGPYDYTPPDYWLADPAQNGSKLGGAYGFATEISPGAAVPPVSSLRKMLPAEHVVPDDPMWNYHAGSERFQTLRHFEDAMNAIYGSPTDLADYERKSQAMAYDSERAMFEAYSRNKYGATGVIQWKLNSAWPSLIWQLWDYYLQPAGAYFGAKKACEPLHVMYSYDDRSVAVVNSTYQPGLNLSVTAKLFDSTLHERFSVTVPVDVAADGVTKAGAFPERAFEPASPVYFVDLVLQDAFGKTVSTNFYWLSSKKNIYDWSAAGNDAFTPVKSYEDFTALSSLPIAGKIDVRVSPPSNDDLVRVSLHNPTNRLAFQVSLDFQDIPPDTQAPPVRWDDNYISLMPGESREISAHVGRPGSSEFPSQFQVVVRGWNIVTEMIGMLEVKKPAVKSGTSH
ncbi:MAG: sugar-binding domain-containing protein [Candidatus Acidiferrales bacterium]